jgi:1-acyl-sn-glycerol-3-phosphate acyltransferase
MDFAIDQPRIDRFVARFRPFARWWFRYSMRGFEKLPPSPCLIVGNHSAMGFCEVTCMLTGWTEHFAGTRPVYGLAHDVGLKLPYFGSWLVAVGAIRASRENAIAALRAGHDVLVFPGGDLDAARPFYEPRAVNFGARRGYAHIAHEANVPIVPLATIGAHYTILMAPGGGLAAEALGLKRSVRIARLPIPIGVLAATTMAALAATSVVPAGLGAGLALAALVPPPARITSEFLDPIAPSADIEAVHARVHGVLAKKVSTMKHG